MDVFSADDGMHLGSPRRREQGVDGHESYMAGMSTQPRPLLARKMDVDEGINREHQGSGSSAGIRQIPGPAVGTALSGYAETNVNRSR
jgi:hypothetical protein